MGANLAAVQCPRCPSDAADWAPLFGMGVINGELVREVVGDLFRCQVCGLRWIATSEGDYIPDEDYYWTGREFDAHHHRH